MLYCELCGAEITGKGVPITVENITVNVCQPCSKHGRQHIASKASKAGRDDRGSRRREREKRPEEVFNIKLPSVADNYIKLVKDARTRLGLSQDELAKKIGEQVQVVELIERGKFKPGEDLARKLQEALAISLFEEEAHAQK